MYKVEVWGWSVAQTPRLSRESLDFEDFEPALEMMILNAVDLTSGRHIAVDCLSIPIEEGRSLHLSVAAIWIERR